MNRVPCFICKQAVPESQTVSLIAPNGRDMVFACTRHYGVEEERKAQEDATNV